MRARWAIALALASAAPAAHAQIALRLQADPALRAAIVSGVSHERPEVRFVSTSTAPLAFEVRALAGQLELVTALEGRAVEARLIGDVSAPDAAARRAVLLIVARVDELGRPVAPPPAPVVRTPAAVPLPIGSPVAPVGEAPAALGVELAGTASLWSGARLGLTVAAMARLGDFRAGARLVAIGFCCTVEGQNIEADGWTLAALAEGRWMPLSGAVDIGVLAAFGAALEAMDARSVGLFEGPAGFEAAPLWSPMARTGLVVEARLARRVSLVGAAGAQLHLGPWSVRLPAPWSEDKAPLERATVQPFLDLGLSVDLF